MLVLVLVIVIGIVIAIMNADIEETKVQFDHEKLHVYQASLEFVGRINSMIDGMEGTQRHVRDQLIRASLSVPLNIAEGNGKRSTSDRKRFFEIARGSAMECAATLDVLVTIGAKTIEEVDPAKALLFRIVAMLSKTTESQESMVRENETGYGRDFDGIKRKRDELERDDGGGECVRNTNENE